jgi:hypothetical protein
MLNLKQELGLVKIGDPAIFGGLAVFPLLRESREQRDYLTLNEALKKDGVRVTEVSDSGNVPELLLKNLLDKDVFASDGEALIGAKQNRILNSSLFVNAKSEIVIPVSCVERGRWSYRRRNFRASKYSEFVSSRSAKMASVSESLRYGDFKRAANQGEVWQQMDAKREYFQAEAPTCSMSDIYESKEPSLELYVRQFKARPNQVGLACAIDGQIAGVELFESADVYAQYAGKLVRAYASEVLGQENYEAHIPGHRDIQDWLQRVSNLEPREYPGVGTGTELRIEDDDISGSALNVDDRLLHLVVFDNSRGSVQ